PPASAGAGCSNLQSAPCRLVYQLRTPPVASSPALLKRKDGRSPEPGVVAKSWGAAKCLEPLFLPENSCFPPWRVGTTRASRARPPSLLPGRFSPSWRNKRVPAPCSVFLVPRRRYGRTRPQPRGRTQVEVHQGQALLPDHDHHDDPEHERHGEQGRAEAGTHLLRRVEGDHG